jgi:hypothetical protein
MVILFSWGKKARKCLTGFFSGPRWTRQKKLQNLDSIQLEGRTKGPRALRSAIKEVAIYHVTDHVMKLNVASLCSPFVYGFNLLWP